MKIACPKCENKYEIPESMITSQTIKSFKCYKCNEENTKELFIQKSAILASEKLETKSENEQPQLTNPSQFIKPEPINMTINSDNNEIFKKLMIVSGIFSALLLFVYLMLKK